MARLTFPVYLPSGGYFGLVSGRGRGGHVIVLCLCDLCCRLRFCGWGLLSLLTGLPILLWWTRRFCLRLRESGALLVFLVVSGALWRRSGGVFLRFLDLP